MLWLSNRLAQKPLIYFEAIIYTALVLIIFRFLSPADPLLLEASFPWIWLVSIAIALRAGTLVGLISYISIIAGFYILAEPSLSELPTQLNLLGGLILTVLCGEFSSNASMRIRQWQQISLYAEQQLNLTAHAYYLMKQSHNHLEQQLIMKPTSLRSCMTELRDLIRDCHGRFEKEQCEHLMRLISHYCSIQSCGFYVWQNGKLSKEAICEYEFKEPLNLNDPVVALATKHMTPYLNTKLTDTDLKHSHYLMAFPVKAFDGICLAFFVVKKMPFFSFHTENFQLIRMMLEYYANSIELYNKPIPLLSIYPDCRPEFALELQKMILLDRQLQVTSYLVAVFIENNSRQDAILYELSQNHRGLDIQWQHRTSNAVVLLIIMPFSDYSDVVGYRNRIIRLPQMDSSINLKTSPIKISSLPIQKNSDSIGLIKEILAT